VAKWHNNKIRQVKEWVLVAQRKTLARKIQTANNTKQTNEEKLFRVVGVFRGS